MVKKVRFNVLLTESQYQTLKAFAEQEETTMAEVVKNFIKTLKLKKPVKEDT